MRDTGQNSTDELAPAGSGVPHGESGFLSTAASLDLPVGSMIEPEGVRGYYIDLRSKLREPQWPPAWLAPPDVQLHVETVQWALGAHEAHLHDNDRRWLDAATEAGEYLVSLIDEQGALLHGRPMPHTFRLDPPWVSAMAQGEAASLFVRLHLATGREDFAEAARAALRPMSVLSAEGGAMALLAGRPFPEEYPTEPPSYVLNGGIFALWGYLDVGRGLADTEALAAWEEGVGLLADVIGRYDLGYWSRYDLFPHTVVNVASAGYHSLHINQLRATQIVDPHPELERAIESFCRYRDSRLCRSRAFARKALFRLLVPRNRFLARRMPGSHAAS
jgi:hypothetical protein